MGLPGGGSGAGPPAPRALGPGEEGGLLRGADPGAGSVGKERGEEPALQERTPLLRRKLYMGALVAVRHDPEMRAFYHRLLSRGKRKKQALLAVAHKLLRRMMGRLREYYATQLDQGVA